MIASKIAWVCRTLAPWCAAGGLLLSFTADAGQDYAAGASAASRASRAALMPEELIPAQRALLTGRPSLQLEFGPDGLAQPVPQDARLVTGEGVDLRSRPDETPPKLDLKQRPGPPPSVNRTGRGDPFVGLRPSFDTRLRAPGATDSGRAAAMVFDIDESQPVSVFQPREGEIADLEAAETFAEPSQGAFASRHAGKPDFQDGATPALPRAVELASTTPSAPDVTPVTVSVVELSAQRGVSVAERAPGQPDFAALIDPQSADSEERCLAQAIYFEARSEPKEGMAAVAQVVLNRVKSGLYPDTVCGVVFQNRSRYKACQFSFACEGKSLRITEFDSWQTAQRIAREVTTGTTYLSDVGGSTHYHANYVRPSWASRLKRMDKIGHHIFYRLRSG
jgi:Cell Wall Hydrolase